MKTTTLLLLNLLIFVKGFGQADTARNIKWILKTTPSHIFDFDNTFTIGAEHFLKPTKSIQFEGGYGNTNQNLLIGIEDAGNTLESQYRGFDVVRLRSEYRKYTKRNKSKSPQGMYNALEVFFKYVGKETYIPIGRQAIGFLPDYWEYDMVRHQRFVYGSHFKFGNQFYIFEDEKLKTSRWLMDIYLGVGFRHIRNGYDYESKRPDDILQNSGGSFGKVFERNGKLTVISGTLGFKLCYILK